MFVSAAESALCWSMEQPWVMQRDPAASTCGVCVCECTVCVYRCVLKWCKVPLVHANPPAECALGPVLMLNLSREMPFFCPSWLPCLFRQSFCWCLVLGPLQAVSPGLGVLLQLLGAFPGKLLQPVLEWGEEIHVSLAGPALSCLLCDAAWGWAACPPRLQGMRDGCC